MSKLEDLNDPKFRLSEGVMKKVRGGKDTERTEGDADAPEDGRSTGDDYSTAPGVTDHCDFETPKNDYVYCTASPSATL